MISQYQTDETRRVGVGRRGVSRFHWVMIARVILFATSLANVAWMVSQPGWEPLVALIATVGGYIAKDVVDYRRDKNDDEKRYHDSISVLRDIRALIGHVDFDKRALSENSAARKSLENIQRSLDVVFRRVQHQSRVSDEDAPL